MVLKNNNTEGEEFKMRKGERPAQLLVLENYPFQMQIVEKIDENETFRGVGAFGSTDDVKPFLGKMEVKPIIGETATNPLRTDSNESVLSENLFTSSPNTESFQYEGPDDVLT